jgi:hypothetical protein
MNIKTEHDRSPHAARARSKQQKEDVMRVELLTEGGVAFFPGLSKPIVIESADLPQAQASRLEQLVEAAHFFDLPAASRAVPKNAADVRRYVVTVEDGKRRHTVRFVDPVEDPNQQSLLDFLHDQRIVQRRAANTSTERE